MGNYSIEMKIAKTAAKNWGQAEPQNLEEAKGITWGSEVSSIQGIVKVLGLPPEMEEKMIQDVYESDTITPEIAKEIQKRIIGITGTANPNIIKMLSTVHDEWVRNNPNNFMKETEKGNKEYQFVPLELLSWKEAKSDLLFLKPILEAAGVNVDEKAVEQQFEVAQKEFLEEHGIVSKEALKRKISSGSKFYPALEGLETKFGGNIEELLKDPKIADEMASQIESRVKIESVEQKIKQELLNGEDTIGFVHHLTEGKVSGVLSELGRGKAMTKSMFYLGKEKGLGFPENIIYAQNGQGGPTAWEEYESRFYEIKNDSPDWQKKVVEKRQKKLRHFQQKVSNSRDGKYDKEGIISIPRYDTNSGYTYEPGQTPEPPKAWVKRYYNIDVTLRELANAGILPEDFNWREKAKVSAKDIADADREQTLTTTEIGGFKGFMKKLLDKFKGKGEK